MNIRKFFSPGSMHVSQSLDIDDGPSKSQIIDAFKYCHNGNVSIPLKFTLYPENRKEGVEYTPYYARNFAVESVEYRSEESGADLVLYGTFEILLPGVRRLLPSAGVAETTSCYFKATYNEGTRKGTLEYVRKK